MKQKSAHEPKAKVMKAEEVWDDAQQVASVLRQNLQRAEPVVRLPYRCQFFFLRSIISVQTN